MSQPDPSIHRLRILATSDLHMHLLSHDDCTDRPDPSVGLSRTASLIAAARAETTGLVLLLDNGDSFQGAPMGDVAVAEPDRTHPLMTAFQHLNYDAIGLGNHDFNYGLPALSGALWDAPGPVLCSNMHARARQSLPFAPWTILHRDLGGHALRIGLFSVLPPQTVSWDARHLAETVTVSDIVPAARRTVSQLQASGTDVIIALCHSGLDDAEALPGQENAAIPLAALEGIDALVTGHTHLTLPGPAHHGMSHVDADRGTIHGKPAVMPGMGGSHLGVIDLDLTATQGGWTITGHHSSLRAIARRQGTSLLPLVPEDPDLKASLASDHQNTRTRLRRPFGHTDRALHSYLTFVAPDAALALVAAAQSRAARPHVPDGMPLLSAVAPGKSGGRGGALAYADIPAGPLLERHLSDLQVFPNDLSLLQIDGQTLHDWLEMAVSLYRHIKPGSQGSLLINPRMPGHACDVVFGLSYSIDLSVPARFRPDGHQDNDSRRIHNLCHAGQAVSPDARFAVVVNSYRAQGGGNVAPLRAATALPLPQIAIRDAIRDAVQDDDLPLPPDPRRFLPLPDTTVVLTTGPGVRAHLADLGDRPVAVGQIDEAGFLALTLAL